MEIFQLYTSAVFGNVRFRLGCAVEQRAAVDIVGAGSYKVLPGSKFFFPVVLRLACGVVRNFLSGRICQLRASDTRLGTVSVLSMKTTVGFSPALYRNIKLSF